MKKLFYFSNDFCNIYIRLLWIDLIIYKPDFINLRAWGFDADGAFAICTPWFDLYPYNGLFGWR